MFCDTGEQYLTQCDDVNDTNSTYVYDKEDDTILNDAQSQFFSQPERCDNSDEVGKYTS